MKFMDYINEKGLILIPVLYIIGIAIKGTKKIPDKYIPIILLVIGEIFAVLIFGVNVDAFLQGILLTGTTVYGNQIVKQLGKTECTDTCNSDTSAANTDNSDTSSTASSNLETSSKEETTEEKHTSTDVKKDE